MDPKTIATIEHAICDASGKLSSDSHGDGSNQQNENNIRSGTDNSNIASDVSLPDSVLEKLYHSYSIKQRRAGLDWFLVSSILFHIWAIVIPQGQSYGAIAITGVILIINSCLLILLRLSGDGKLCKAAWEIAPHLIWFLAILQLFFYLLLKTPVTPRDFLGWGILLNFLVYVTLPVPLLCTGILLGIGSIAIYISTIIGLAKKEPYFWEQVGANVVLILAAAVIGLLYYFLGEAKQKRAFLEAKKSLEVKMVIEEQSAEQERLLLSVLPEHVAVKMRQDLGSTNSEQFKKIYMSRHENVSFMKTCRDLELKHIDREFKKSFTKDFEINYGFRSVLAGILYADIVGFTAISSTYSAQDLVKMLNELFARFDRLAEKYQQLRIKILGDCYYCISGAPVERPDHAVLCVHMGLSMVKAIKYVQQKANSPVDMRVGIHTGAVLAGVLGQRQWQFDVYSKDVELANKMESSGKAGRVHISEKTLGFLNGEFEVEPAFGEKREEALRIAGLKTYFITKVVKPFVSSSDQKKNGTASLNKTATDTIEKATSTEIVPDDDSKANSGDDEPNPNADKDKEEDFKRRLRKELVSRDGHGDLSKDTTFFLSFKSAELEYSYAEHREPGSSIPLVASLLVQIIDLIYSTLILPRNCLHFAIITAPLILITLLVLISVAESFPGILSEALVKSSKKFNDIFVLRRLAAVLIILLVNLSNLTDMFLYSITDPMKTDNPDNITSTLSSNLMGMEQIPPTTLDFILYPSYMSNFCVLILISISVIAQLTHLCKIFFMLLITVLHCVMNLIFLENHFKYEEQQMWNIGLPTRFNVSAVLFVVALSLSFFARHMDKEDRVIFKWKTEVAEQKEKVSDMRRRNEALVYNVLPVHVAEHFMKNKKRSHDDLYSQSYAEVGVLFASMPNFTDFYSEETVNNQGLECLRFLNEVISDYDALLELPQFQDIIKIKTIGSTYMAASGLNPSRQVKPDDPVIVRWAHLALLVEFALELKKALHGINEQSFNHFVLKMGINHGPITAGVIGARKPHYDIWGNTVNVASRMESTGKAGAIQVTEETCEILQTFGYTFEQRGLVSVKGKGQLMTYYLQGKIPRPNPPSSPIISNINTMETLPELEEPADSPKVPLKLQTDNSPSNSSNTNNDNCDKIKSTQNLIIHQNQIELNLKFDNSDQYDHDKNQETKLFDKNTNIDIHLNNYDKKLIKDDPRSPKNTNNTFILDTINQSINNVEQLSTISKHRNGIDNTELDVEIDVKTPLLNLNSTNLDTKEYNASEKDSLISKQ